MSGDRCGVLGYRVWKDRCVVSGYFFFNNKFISSMLHYRPSAVLHA